MPCVLSVDLAAVRYADNGIALLDGRPGRIKCRLLRAESLGLSGRPSVEPFADAIAGLAQREGAGLILLDGPQGWRREQSSLVHQRLCERETRTPGKTGLPGIVKPATWTRMAEFCIALFDALEERGWPRLRADWTSAPAAIESFPTQAWRSLGEPPLPSKAKVNDLRPWVERLESRGVEELPAAIGHDELQAVVAGLAGVQMLDGGWAAVDARGCDPLREGQHWREGWIVSPRA